MRLMLSVLILSMLVTAAGAKIIYVAHDAGGANDGSSWADAYTFLQDALADASLSEKPVEIRVAQGIYKPDQGASQTPRDRRATFQLINGVTLKGGFAGLSEPAPNGGDIDWLETILSGDLADNDIDVNDLTELFREPTRADNSFNVVTGSRTDETAMMDGFTITGGSADDSYFNNTPQSKGGGMYNDQGAPVIACCTFARNASFEGGGMYNNNANPTLINCRFTANVADYFRPSDVWFAGTGGGMHNNHSNPTLTNCTFEGNYSGSGGGIWNGDSSNPALTDCDFIGNSAASGGGVASYHSSNPILLNCTFRENSAISGGGMSNGFEGSPTVTDCTFTENWAHNSGGGIAIEGFCSVALIKCIMRGNLARQGGGLRCSDNSSATLSDCIVAENSADFSGGGVSCSLNSDVTLSSSIFEENSALVQGGGVMGSLNASVDMTDCVITDNRAMTGVGGGMQFSDTFATVTNCVIAHNTAALGGGGVGCRASGFLSIRNCTISANHSGRSDYGGGGVGCFFAVSAEITNSIICGNISPSGNEIAVTRSALALLTITHSNITGGQAAVVVDSGATLNWGEGNIDADPLFARPGYWADVNNVNTVVEPNDPNALWVDGDYHLKSQAGRWDPVSQSWVVDDVTSPCIDAGDPNSPVGGEPEPNGGIINMGAYSGTEQASMSPFVAEIVVYIQWLGHSSVKVWTEDCIVYVDPQNLNISPHDATLVCVTHRHSDHYSPSDIARVSNAQTQFIAPPDVVQRYGRGRTIAPDQTIEFDFVTLTTVPAYNTNKPNHPKSNNWVGYITELGGQRIYVAGDTDLIDEMKSLGDIDVAILPAGGTYTMNATEAAEATQYIKSDLAIPYHWGRNVGTLSDAQRFSELAHCPVKILAVGETIGSDNWLQ
jgi:L-ascorbate metabolism protein UlaG (beta-lactamase superfamily)